MVDMADLERPNGLDNDEHAIRAVQNLIALATTLAGNSAAHAFTLLLTTMGDFAARSDAEVDLLQVAVFELGTQLDEAALAAGNAAAPAGDAAWMDRALARMSPHDPTGSPIEMAAADRLSAECAEDTASCESCESPLGCAPEDCVERQPMPIEMAVIAGAEPESGVELELEVDSDPNFDPSGGHP